MQQGTRKSAIKIQQERTTSKFTSRCLIYESWMKVLLKIIHIQSRWWIYSQFSYLREIFSTCHNHYIFCMVHRVCIVSNASTLKHIASRFTMAVYGESTTKKTTFWRRFFDPTQTWFGWKITSAQSKCMELFKSKTFLLHKHFIFKNTTNAHITIFLKNPYEKWPPGI